MAELYHRFEGYERLKPLLAGSDEDVLVALEGKPALIRIPGTARMPRARLFAGLLHGNEDSGYRALLNALRETEHYPFDLWVLIGNVRAASTDGWFAHRQLDDQEDFNRVWGLNPPTTRMRRCAAAILEELVGADLEGAVDLHNNTGQNPFYAITPTPTTASLHLSSLCADTVLLWRLPAHTLMEALLHRCPAIAVECGQPGSPDHTAFAERVVQRVLSAPTLEGDDRPQHVFEMRARVTVREEVAFAFGGQLSDELDLVLVPGHDGANFGMLLAGTDLGYVHPGGAMPLEIRDMHDRDVTDHLLAVTDEGALVLRQDVTPVMLTTTVRQTRRDCLFYVARRRA